MPRRDHRGSAHRAVFQALAERETKGVDELRALEVARLDRLQVALWDRAVGGDLVAVTSVLRIIEQRTRLLGLDRRGLDDGHHQGPTHLVVGPLEGNLRDAT